MTKVVKLCSEQKAKKMKDWSDEDYLSLSSYRSQNMA